MRCLCLEKFCKRKQLCWFLHPCPTYGGFGSTICIKTRGYAQKNPKQEYKREAFEMFGAMLESVKLEVTRTLLAVQIRSREEVEAVEKQQAAVVENVQYQHASIDEAVAAESGAGDAAPPKQQPFQRHLGKIGRNDPCPCGSGKKYKQCHGKLS